MTYELFASGAIGSLLGALVGGFITYRFNLIIHREQLESQQKSQDAFTASLERIVESVCNATAGLKLQLGTECQSLVKAIEGRNRD